MKTFQIITQPNCLKCNILKEWLDDLNVHFEEWDIEDKKIVDQLLKDPIFDAKYVYIGGCDLPTPAIHIDETGEYFAKELFGIDGIRKDFIKKIIDL